MATNSLTSCTGTIQTWLVSYAPLLHLPLALTQIAVLFLLLFMQSGTTTGPNYAMPLQTICTFLCDKLSGSQVNSTTAL